MPFIYNIDSPARLSEAALAQLASNLGKMELLWDDELSEGSDKELEELLFSTIGLLYVTASNLLLLGRSYAYTDDLAMLLQTKAEGLCQCLPTSCSQIRDTIKTTYQEIEYATSNILRRI